jgi:Putative DNA-binding domain
MNAATTHLAQQRAAMLASILGRDNRRGLHAKAEEQTHLQDRGMQVYRANAAALAERTLGSTFPVLAQLIGETSFEPLARHFWRQHPPARGDMAQWGHLLAAFLASAPQLAGEPYLADVARVEWALHQAATAADASLDAASFALLTDSDAPVTLALSASCALLPSAYPVATLVNAHLLGVPALSVAAQQLASGVQETALVWRHGFKPRVRAVGAGEALLLEALLLCQPLDDALQAACDKADDFDFNVWLSQAVQTGLVTGAMALTTTDSNISKP